VAIVLCDLDGTLLVKDRPDPPGTVAPKRAAINRALAEVCDCPRVDFVQGLEHGLTDWQIAERALRIHQPATRIDGPTWRAVCARAEAVFAPGPTGGEPIYRCLPGVPAILEALREAGWRLGIGTGNLAFFALYKLAQAGIDRAIFDGPLAFGDHGRDREQLLRTAVALAGSESLVVLGDTVHDHAAARAVGLPFLGTGAMGLRREDLDESAAWVPDLSDAAAVLAVLAGLAPDAGSGKG
jgi:phosphoglycolate phosphatase-like HAD superfamily hydrolase